MARWHQLQREAMQCLSEMETAAKFAIGFQEKLEPFMEWLEDFESLDGGKIGLTHKEIETVFHDVQVSAACSVQCTKAIGSVQTLHAARFLHYFNQAD